VKSGRAADEYAGVAGLIHEAGIESVPKGAVAVFVGNAWDPRDVRETPWIDIAPQLAGDRGRRTGPSREKHAAGTEAIARVFKAADETVWFQEPVPADEVAFEPGVFLLRKSKAVSLEGGAVVPQQPTLIDHEPEMKRDGSVFTPPPSVTATKRTLRIVGSVPSEVWESLPKLRSGSELKIGVDFSITIDSVAAANLTSELRQILEELGVGSSVRIE